MASREASILAAGQRQRQREKLLQEYFPFRSGGQKVDLVAARLTEGI